MIYEEYCMPAETRHRADSATAYHITCKFNQLDRSQSAHMKPNFNPNLLNHIKNQNSVPKENCIEFFCYTPRSSDLENVLESYHVISENSVYKGIRHNMHTFI
jgi:hypothetical protein